MIKRILVLAVGILCFIGQALYGQANTGVILGSVSDASGARVPSAAVTVTNTGTNESRRTSTNSTGEYSVPGLSPGHYIVTIETPAFAKYEHSNLQLDVNQQLRVDANLSVRNGSEVVTVSSEPPMIQTETSSVGQVVEAAQAEELPLNGRFFLQLAQLTTGTNGGSNANQQQRRNIGNVALSANGARPYSNDYLIDGMDNNLAVNGYIGFSPSIDAIQEFKVQTNSYNAQFGRSAGAQVNLILKSGTNRVHGSAYEFLRNSAVDANNYFAKKAGLPLPPYRQNQPGFSVGGPVVIPHLINGRDRTFFFFSYERLLIRLGQTFLTSVPTAAMRAGNFAGLPTIYDPLNVVDGVRQPFQNNQIPQNRFDGAATYLQQYVPLPNLPGTANNFARNASQADDSYQFTVRIDQNISASDHIYGRVSRYSRLVNNPSAFGTPAIGNGGLDSGSHQTMSPFQSQISETHVFSQSVVNTFQIGYKRFPWLFTQLNVGHDYTAAAGIQGVSTNPAVVGFPYIEISGFNNWGDGQYVPNPQTPEDDLIVMDTVNWVKGRHTIALGGDLRRNHLNFTSAPQGRGVFAYNGVFTAQSTAVSGTPYADFLLGYPSSAAETIGLQEDYTRAWYYDFFAEDDVKASNRLTLNLGLRYEQDRPPTEIHGYMTSFDPATGNETFANLSLVPPGYPYGSEKSINDSNTEPDNNNFGPRVGFAYRLTNDNKTVLRAAYGIFNDLESTNPQLNLGSNPPLQYNNSFSQGPTTPTTYVEQVFAGTPTFGSHPSISIITKNFRIGYVQQWNMAVQREFYPGFSLDVAYIGSKGTKLPQPVNINQPTPGPGAIQPRRPFPLFGSIGGTGSTGASSYNGLQAKLEKRLSNGFSFLSSFTYSKSLDTNSDVFAGAPNPLNTSSNEWGPSDFDNKISFVQSGLYALPIGRGQVLLGNANRLTQATLGGWNISGIYTYRTGFPFTPTIGNDQANIGTGGQRPNLSGNPSVSNPNVTRWFNPAAYSLPAQYTFGNVRRNSLRGPRYNEIDFSVRKVVDISESQHIEFRVEFFNLTNHTDFANPNATITNSSAGTISSVVNRPREIQGALRYWF